MEGENGFLILLLWLLAGAHFPRYEAANKLRFRTLKAGSCYLGIANAAAIIRE